MKNKILFVIMDGVADVGKRTALDIAKKPNLDQLAQHSYCGLWKAKLPYGYNIASFSDVAILQLLGCYDYPGRGYLEALGIGLKPKKGSICFRANFATAKKIRNSKNSRREFSYNIIDRRAGRDETGLDVLAKAINKIKITSVKGAKVKFYRSVGHRGILVIEGRNLASVADIDKGKPGQLVLPSVKMSSEKRTLLVLHEFMNKVYEILDKHSVNKKRKKKANFLLLRGAGCVMKTRTFAQRFGMKACVISGVGITKGIARFLDMDVIDVKGATGHFQTNLSGKIDAAMKAFNSKPHGGSYDMVVLHVNGADEAGHDKDCVAKMRFIEMVDEKMFSKIIVRKEISVVVAGDHITSCKTGKHMVGPVPFMIYDANDDLVKSFSKVSYNIKFDEQHCKKGFITNNPMERVLLALRK